MTLSTDNLDFLLDPLTGDLDLTGGRLNFARGLSGVAQLSKIRLNTIRGELVWDTSFGMPWFANIHVTAAQAILGQKYNQQRATQACYNMLITVPNVTEVILLNVSFVGKTRKLSVQYQLRTTFGDTPVLEL